MIKGIPSYYHADDLLLQELYNEGCRICGNKPVYTTPLQPDTFEFTTKKDKIKKGLTIGGIAAAVIAAGAWAIKHFFGK